MAPSLCALALLACLCAAAAQYAPPPPAAEAAAAAEEAYLAAGRSRRAIRRQRRAEAFARGLLVAGSGSNAPSGDASYSPSVAPSFGSASASHSHSEAAAPTYAASLHASFEPSGSFAASHAPSGSFRPSAGAAPPGAVAPGGGAAPKPGGTPSRTPSRTGTPSRSSSNTRTPSTTRTPTGTLSPGASPSTSSTLSATPTHTSTRSGSHTPRKPKERPSDSNSKTTTRTPTSSRSNGASAPRTGSNSRTPSRSSTGSPSGTRTPTRSATASPTPTPALSVGASASHTSSDSSSGTPTPSETPSDSPSRTPSQTPTPSLTEGASPSHTPSNSAYPSESMTNLPSPSNTPSPSTTRSAPGGTPTPSTSHTSTNTRINVDATVSLSIVISMDPSSSQALKDAMAALQISWLGLDSATTTYTVTTAADGTSLSFNFLVSTAAVPVYNPFSRRRELTTVTSVAEATAALDSLTASKTSDGSLALDLATTGLSSSIGYATAEDATNAVTPLAAAVAVVASPSPSPSTQPTPAAVLSYNATIVKATILLPLAENAAANGAAAASVLFPITYYGVYAQAIAGVLKVDSAAVSVTSVTLRLYSDQVNSALEGTGPLGYQMALSFDADKVRTALGISRRLSISSDVIQKVTAQIDASLSATDALSNAFKELPALVLATAGYSENYLFGKQFTDLTAANGGLSALAAPPSAAPSPAVLASTARVFIITQSLPIASSFDFSPFRTFFAASIASALNVLPQYVVVTSITSTTTNTLFTIALDGSAFGFSRALQVSCSTLTSISSAISSALTSTALSNAFCAVEAFRSNFIALCQSNGEAKADFKALVASNAPAISTSLSSTCTGETPTPSARASAAAASSAALANSSLGGIIGGVLGGVVLVGALAAAAIYQFQRSAGDKQPAPASPGARAPVAAAAAGQQAPRPAGVQLRSPAAVPLAPVVPTTATEDIYRMP